MAQMDKDDKQKVSLSTHACHRVAPLPCCVKSILTGSSAAQQELDEFETRKRERAEAAEAAHQKRVAKRQKKKAKKNAKKSGDAAGTVATSWFGMAWVLGWYRLVHGIG